MKELRSLLLGCGHSRVKKVFRAGHEEWTGRLTTIDINPACLADLMWDLNHRPLPFEDEVFDELGAYDVLEHQGQQGDWRGWFDEMAEYHRILKPGGTFGIIVPIGADALADPGHTRFFSKAYFSFLNQAFYVEAQKQGAAATDYRWYWKRNFEIDHLDDSSGRCLSVMLRKA